MLQFSRLISSFSGSPEMYMDIISNETNLIDK